MLTTAQFIAAAQAGTIDRTKVRVVVDNDCVDAYDTSLPGGDGPHLCDFDGNGPERVLIAVLQGMGLDADGA